MHAVSRHKCLSTPRQAWLTLSGFSAHSDGAWFMHGTSVTTYAREPSRQNTPRGWTFIRLVGRRTLLALILANRASSCLTPFFLPGAKQEESWISRDAASTRLETDDGRAQRAECVRSSIAVSLCADAARLTSGLSLGVLVDLSLISEVALKTSYPTSRSVNVVSFNEKKGDTMRVSASNGSGGGVLKVANELSFSLLAGGEVSLLE